MKKLFNTPKSLGGLFLAIGVFGTLGILFIISRNIWIETTATQMTGMIVEVKRHRIGGGSSGRTYFSHIVEVSQNGQAKRYKAEVDLGGSLRGGSTPVLLTSDDKLYIHNHKAMYWTQLPKLLLTIPFIIAGVFIRRL